MLLPSRVLASVSLPAHLLPFSMLQQQKVLMQRKSLLILRMRYDSSSTVYHFLTGFRSIQNCCHLLLNVADFQSGVTLYRRGCPSLVDHQLQSLFLNRYGLQRSFSLAFSHYFLRWHLPESLAFYSTLSLMCPCLTSMMTSWHSFRARFLEENLLLAHI